MGRELKCAHRLALVAGHDPATIVHKCASKKMKEILCPSPFQSPDITSQDGAGAETKKILDRRSPARPVSFVCQSLELRQSLRHEVRRGAIAKWPTKAVPAFLTKRVSAISWLDCRDSATTTMLRYAKLRTRLFGCASAAPRAV